METRNTGDGKIHLLLHSERVIIAKTGNVHYIRAWRRERLNAHKEYEFDCFVLTHSTDSGLFYEERYDDLTHLAKRKTKILHYWRKKAS